LIARLRNNALLRALRVGKLTLAALAATLHCYRDRSWRERLPIFRMLATTLDDLHSRAKLYVAVIPNASVVESAAYIGGGALPEARVESLAIALPSPKPTDLAARLRRGKPAIVARIESGRVLLDLRTILPEDDARAIAAITEGEPG
jgi:L-seryl-tRNA(Ser) seleniumtransferase